VEIKMKQALAEARKFTLCGLARMACVSVRRNSAIVELEDVQPLCCAVASLCKDHGCEKPAAQCLKASKAKTEVDFIKFCQKSCKACTTQRKPEEGSEKRQYVA